MNREKQELKEAIAALQLRLQDFEEKRKISLFKLQVLTTKLKEALDKTNGGEIKL
jgi:hypothetical protein